jgi:hypothetical protein
MAADFAHPKAVNIAIQGVGPAQVCYYTGPVGLPGPALGELIPLVPAQ